MSLRRFGFLHPCLEGLVRLLGLEVFLLTLISFLVSLRRKRLIAFWSSSLSSSLSEFPSSSELELSLESGDDPPLRPPPRMRLGLALPSSELSEQSFSESSASEELVPSSLLSASSASNQRVAAFRVENFRELSLLVGKPRVAFW